MATDFNLRVSRILTRAGSHVTDMVWTHVINQLGYNIYRAESDSDDPADWYKINNKLIQVNYFQDRGFTGDATDNGRIQWYYKVIPVDLENNEYALSQSKSETFEVPLNGIQRFVAPVIRSRTNILLDPTAFSAAEVVHFLVRKWAGSYCSCIDVRTRKVDASCGSCMGTGYSGGYALIENVYCHIRSATKSLLENSGGITIDENLTGIISTYPILVDGDILVRLGNERFRVRNVKRRQIQNYTTAQSFQLEPVQLFDMAYRFPAPPIVRPTNRQGMENPNVI